MKLNERYSRNLFLNIVNSLKNEIKTINQEFDYKSDVVNKAFLLGKIKSLDLDVIEIEISVNIKSRIKITSEAFKLLKSMSSTRALVSFYSKDNKSGNWRLSLLTTDYKIEKGKILKEQSNPKRFSYVLGENAKIHTPTRFLLRDGEVTDFEDLRNRFSLSVVNKDFYIRLAELYTKLVGGIRYKGSTQTVYDGMLKINGSSKQNIEKQEFGVKLIGRLVFCWFLKEKKSNEGVSLIPEELLSSKFLRPQNYYNQILEPLFFELLNTKVNRRIERYKKRKYDIIPYLNGGLFKPQSQDYYNPSNFGKDPIELPVYIPNEWFKEFFELLEQYNFTVDENTNNDIELSIDPEMLGRIFENLLAEINPETGETARKSTGSFYTPREIVENMVTMSLSSYLYNKTKIEKERLYTFIEEVGTLENISHDFTKTEIFKIIEALSEIKIIDPACGSGAFPIGMLQKMVAILENLDGNSSIWIDLQLKDASIELKKQIKNKLSTNNLNYIRKLGLIKESIFGVDIQPIATEIAKLRCFLTLIVEEDVKDNEANRGIEPLPNLDFKFVTANSLVQLEDDLGFGEIEFVDKLSKIRGKYFTANYEERLELQAEFSNIQNDMSLFVTDFWGSAGGNETLEMLRRWRPFDYNKTDWFDSNWMFGTNKFDVVIMNPPYLDSENMSRESPDFRKLLSDTYLTASGNWDLFIVFIELSSNLLSKNGSMVYIVPNKLISQKYANKSRELLIKKFYIDQVKDFSSVNVFKDADVYPIVMNVSKQKQAEYIYGYVMDDVDVINRKNSIKRELINKDNMDMIFIKDKIILDIINKMDENIKLMALAKDIRDASTVSDAYRVKEHLYDSLDDNEESFKLINSGTIDPYRSLWGINNTQYIKDSYKYPRIKLEKLKLISRRHEDALKEKVIIANMTSRLEAFYDKGEYLAAKSTIMVADSELDLMVLTGILNSKLLTFYYRIKYKSTQMQGGALSLSKHRVQNIPIPDLNDEIINKIKKTVKRLKKDFNQNDIECLDDIVYKLYKLTEDEQKYLKSFNI